MKKIVFGAFAALLSLAGSALAYGDSSVGVKHILNLAIIFGIMFTLMILFQVLIECLEGA